MLSRSKLLLFLFFIISTKFIVANSSSLNKPNILIQDVTQEYSINQVISKPDMLSINGIDTDFTFDKNEIIFKYVSKEKEKITINFNGETLTEELNPIPLYYSILPPLVAVIIALILKEVVTALFLGLLSGVGVIGFYQEGFMGLLKAPFKIANTYLLDSISEGSTMGNGNSSHISIILFSVFIGGVVAIISKNGGMKGIVNRISTIANNSKNAQLATYFLGIGIFFDDYANTLVVGNTMRSVTDKLKISREKLAYLVDSTAAPIAAIGLVTTWIGAELQYISDGVKVINSSSEQIKEGTYAIFLSSIQYSYYPIFTLIFMFILVYTQRDFGPMLKAELKARNTEPKPQSNSKNINDELKEFEPKEEIKPKSFNAIIPILTLVIGTLIGLLITGWDDQIIETDISLSRKLSVIIGQSDSYTALLWSSMGALIIASVMTISQNILDLKETVEVAIQGFKTMITAVIILILAWALALTTHQLHTSDFLIQLLGNDFSPWIIPAMTSILSAIISFSTGSSWSTMAILYPLMLPVSWKIGLDAGLSHDENMALLSNTISCVLAGSVLGDHCSPISDTTILSSLSSQCNHLDHVKTQFPYALTVGIISILLGTVPSALGISNWIIFPITIATLYLIIIKFGKKVPIYTLNPNS